ncbi:MoxR-like ATPase [Caldanaerobius fijiensis DSM 17918]|uniref:MoxR-like ATPase n=1 Tax=Caldanaerobius fijiensis DSM 17918 TaxID=1121256 RepID=A0A1M5C2B6_9THEO|nr:MoxR family ATPase [Caldanaerobius fijiensis]SHF48806.1 MoxR-like ATPase [Caldanaerobius fijiensis DSM 17918]
MPLKSKEMYDRLNANIKKAIFGKEEQTKLIFISLVAGGHVLLEDVPGVGKTKLAESFARSLDMSLKRIQFTPDLLPQDLIGVNIYNPKEQEFTFRKGPIFTNILLADEINRATPKTQSALLEAMQEKKVTVDGVDYELPGEFMVLATQNPVESSGTFELPEAQLDRFFMKISMGYPSREDELTIMDTYGRFKETEQLQPVLTGQDLVDIRREIEQEVKVSDDIKNYIVELVQTTRRMDTVLLGASPRATIMLAKAAKINAAIEGRDYVIPDDVKAMCIPVLAHRVVLKGMDFDRTPEDVINQLLEEVKAPFEEV